jgi:2-succinyl-5-enolpyruvyl-6-hydroxy-3-cyclohexene-1-carboxylate synthase
MEAKSGMYDIAGICRMHGVENAVLCPGSRCAPLTLAFSRTEGINSRTIVDERSAGFIALGIAETTGKPVVLICTSGSAALNFAPAISEAYYRNIPLLVFTADRPERLLHQQDGQTLNQREVFRNFIRASYFLSGDITNPLQLRYLQRAVNEAMLRTYSGIRGPVHVNLTFEEPLYRLADESSGVPYIQFCSDIFTFEQELRRVARDTGRWLLLVGSKSKNPQDSRILESLSEILPVASEAIGNAGTGKTIPNANEVITFAAGKGLDLLKPDVLIGIGKGVVSKKLKQFLRNKPPHFHFHVDEGETLIDTFGCLTHQVRLPDGHALKSMEEVLGGIKKDVSEEYLKNWKSFSEQVILRTREITERLPYSDITAMQAVCRRIPGKADMHVGNSMAVRYVNLFGYELPAESKIFCNRGTSGIDGSLSTAVGNCIGTGRSLWAVLGDLSFHYDQNGLWNDCTPDNFKVIILNNSGGGIFRLIDGPASVPEITERFEVRTQSSAKWKAEEMGYAYFGASDMEELHTALSRFVNHSGKAILEIFTDPITDEEAFKSFQKQLSQII